MAEGGDASDFDKSRAELFEALGHPIRIKILHALQDGPLGFADLKRKVGIESWMPSATAKRYVCLMLICLLAVNNGLAIWSVAESDASGTVQLTKGTYAVYGESNSSLSSLTGFSNYGAGAPEMENAVWHPPGGNQTIGFDSLSLSWVIDDVLPSYYQVNYTLQFDGMEPSSEWSLLSVELLVSVSNGSAYLLNGSYVGSWPYWLPQASLVVGTDIELIHDYPFATAVNGTPAFVPESPVEFTSLSQGGAEPNGTSGASYLDATLDVPGIGSFMTDRLIITYPHTHVFPLPQGVTVWFNETPANSTVGVNTPIWSAIYDRFSGVLLAYNHADWFTDDIMMHALGVWQIGFNANSLVMTSSNFNLSPEPKGDTLLYPMVLLAVAGVVAAGSLVVWRSRRRRP
ncbi:MAG: winged helix-turn-helix domain-containing protein [Conexivisphaerales archaeon]